MRPRTVSPDPAEAIPERLWWANRPAYDPANPDQYSEWIAERVAWYEDRGISLLDHLREQCQRSAS